VTLELAPAQSTLRSQDRMFESCQAQIHWGSPKSSTSKKVRIFLPEQIYNSSRDFFRGIVGRIYRVISQ
jgi:hypothetical protein